MNKDEKQIRQTDQELVTAVLADRHAFAPLVRLYEASLAQYITRLGCRDPELKKDILQEVFIKAYINLYDYDPTRSFSAWLYRIAHNETINYFRKQKNRPHTVDNEEDLALFDMIVDEFDIQAEVDRRLLQKRVREALQKIDGSYRHVLILRFFENKTYDEISDILRIPSGTVATYINRGKAQLKVQFGQNNLHTV